MTTETEGPRIRLSDHLCKMRGTDEVSPIYKELWNSRDFYAVIKGGKGSGKSYTISLRWIYLMMKYPAANLLVIRKVFDSLRTSCFASLQWAINELGVADKWKMTYSPMEMTYKPTGQKILFKGCDKAEKIGSTNVVTGVLCWCWFEEFYEIGSEEEFDKIAYSIRGDVSKYQGLWKQIVCSMNPWSETWIKKRFFDQKVPGVWVGTTTYRDNDRLDEDDVARWEVLYETDPRRAKIICDGEFGVANGLIYSNWVEKNFDIHRIMSERPNLRFTFGLDFGYAISYNAFVAVAVDTLTRELWVFDEMYDHGMPNIDIAKRITRMGYGKEEIWADAAEPKSIFELQTGIIEKTVGEDGDDAFIKWALPNIRPAMKGPDSVRNGIQNLQSYRMYVHPKCTNTIVELNNYCYDQDKDGNFVDKPIKEFDHCLIGETLIMTDRGEVPIKDLKVGDMVWSHLGLRKITNKIVKEKQKIYTVKFANGIEIKGTSDHPMITTKGVKYLKDISEGDEVIKWVGQAKGTIPVPNMSNMTEYSGTDIQHQKKDQKENISSITTSDCIDMFGKNSMDQSQKDATSIISTETPQITTSQISSCSRQKSTEANTQVVSTFTNGVNNISQKMKTNAESGTDQKKDTNGTKNTDSNLKICKLQNRVNNVAEDLQHRTTGAIDFVHPSARQNGVVSQDAITRQEFVNNVVKSSCAADLQEQDFVLVNVESISVTTEIADVYDITVDEAYDFFANGIYVFDCMDALRYSMVRFFVRAKGMVAEAKGVDRVEVQQIESTVDDKKTESQLIVAEHEGPPIVPRGGRHIRRVYSTH